MRLPGAAAWLLIVLGCHGEPPVQRTTPSASRPDPLRSEQSFTPEPPPSTAPRPEGTVLPEPPPCIDGEDCAIEARGELPREVIRKIIRDNFGRFRACYEKELRKIPELTGRLDVRFVIGRDGAVVNAMINASSLPRSLAECVARAFYQLQFPPPRGGTVVVSYPIVFRRGERQ